MWTHRRVDSTISTANYRANGSVDVIGVYFSNNNINRMRFRYGLVGNIIFFGGTVACLGYFGYLLMASTNSKVQKEALHEIINKNKAKTQPQGSLKAGASPSLVP